MHFPLLHSGTAAPTTCPADPPQMAFQAPPIDPVPADAAVAGAQLNEDVCPAPPKSHDAHVLPGSAVAGTAHKIKLRFTKQEIITILIYRLVMLAIGARLSSHQAHVSASNPGPFDDIHQEIRSTSPN